MNQPLIMPFDGVAPDIAETAFIAPNAAIVGDVRIGPGSSVWYGCTIGDRATVGMQSCLMDGVTIEPGAMVAAGSLVTPGKVIPAGQLWSGRPAKFMRELDEAAIEALLAGVRHYAHLAQEHKRQHPD